MRWRRAVVCATLLVGITVSASGCLVASNSSTSARGTRIARSSLEQVIPGETTRDWLVAAFGRPTTSRKLPDGGELLKYEFTKSRHSNLAVFVLFAGSENVRETKSVAYFELKDGIVQRCWLEE